MLSAQRVGILFVTARDTSKIYEITTSGTLLASISTIPYGSSNPTGVLLDLNTGEPPLSFFCTAKTTVVCGPASISATGVFSATATNGFTVSAGPTLGCRWGLLFYSDLPVQAGIPFGGPGDGVLCLQFPVFAAGVIDSGGTNPTTCDGSLSIDLNAFAQSQYTPGGCHPPLHVTQPATFLATPGVTVNAQIAGRDTLATGRTVSNGLDLRGGALTGPC